MNRIETITSDTDFAGLAGLYARVFAGWPWFEVSVCPDCGNFSAQPTGSVCTCRSETQRTAAYPEAKTIDYILNEISKPLALGLLGFADSPLPVGFGWGYQLSETEFAQNKYKTEIGKQLIASQIPSQNYFYVSEVGVDPASQTKGLGTEITARLSQQDQPLLLRTLNISPMAKIARKLGYRELLSPDTTRDPENPDRIIFIKD